MSERDDNWYYETIPVKGHPGWEIGVTNGSDGIDICLNAANSIFSCIETCGDSLRVYIDAPYDGNINFTIPTKALIAFCKAIDTYSKGTTP